MDTSIKKNYCRINRMVLGKTRVIKKFIWIGKLKGRRKFMEFAHVFQECIQKEGLTDITSTDPEFGLEWVDKEWTDKQKTFLGCDCGNELIGSGSLVSDDLNGVKYKCTDCGDESVWNFDMAPVAVEITNGKGPTPKEMGITQ